MSSNVGEDKIDPSPSDQHASGDVRIITFIFPCDLLSSFCTPAAPCCPDIFSSPGLGLSCLFPRFKREVDFVLNLTVRHITLSTMGLFAGSPV